MKICICSSMSVYKQFMKLKEELEKLGNEVVAPDLVFEVEGAKNTSVGHYFDTHGSIDAFPPDHEVWKKKGNAIRTHFKKIDESDCVLITNYEKKGISNYIGGNTFLEIGYAFGQNKKVFVLNELPAESVYKEEILGMQQTILDGDISKIK